MSSEVSVVWPLLLSTMAGLSTAIGAVLAISTTPCEATLAFLLGTAIGVMATVSVLELWWHKAVEVGSFLGITAAVAAGAILFAVLDPLLPKTPEPHHLLLAADGQQDKQEEPHAVLHLDCKPQVTVATGMKRNPFVARQPSATQLTKVVTHDSSSGSSHSPRSSALLSSGVASNLLLPGQTAASAPGALYAAEGTLAGLEGAATGAASAGSQHVELHLKVQPGANTERSALLELRSHHAGLMRLGLIMAATMTLHNLPEGFAVAFSAFSETGVQMALAIAMHNIPEGLVISAPIYAATGSKARAVAIAAASGLSEPLGALIALFVFRPFVSSVNALNYVLALVGGIMLAVCGLELWPEGRRCQQHSRLYQGILLGSAVMAWTLSAGA